MNKFKKQLRIIEEALLKPMSDERAKELDKERIKIEIDEIKTRYSTLKIIKTYIDLSEMNLTELPIQFGNVEGYVDCSNNKLTTLKGSPAIIDGSFYCSSNNLTSLEGCPREVGRDFYCYNNKLKFTKEEVKAVCNVKGEIYV